MIVNSCVYVFISYILNKIKNEKERIVQYNEQQKQYKRGEKYY
jgi:hypothetical protein